MAHLHIGILLVSPCVELLDCAPMGLFDELSKDYIKAFPDELPPGFKENAADVKFHWIAEGGAAMAAPTTASAAFRVTDDFESCHQLDFMLVPGPDPFVYQLTNATKDFIHKQINGGLYALLTVCSGILPILKSGVFDGKKATCPRMLIPYLKPQHSTVKFSAQRWEVDVSGPKPSHAGLKKSDSVYLRKFDRERNGTELWSSGQTLNGLDMVAQFIKEKFPPEYSAWVVETSQCAQRPIEYDD